MRHVSASGPLTKPKISAQAYLEALVLEDPLDGRILAAGRQLGLEDDSKRAVADDLALGVGKIPVLSRHAIVDLFADDFCCRRQRSVGKPARDRDETYRRCVSWRTPRAGSETWRRDLSGGGSIARERCYRENGGL